MNQRADISRFMELCNSTQKRVRAYNSWQEPTDSLTKARQMIDDCAITTWEAKIKAQKIDPKSRDAWDMWDRAVVHGDKTQRQLKTAIQDNPDIPKVTRDEHEREIEAFIRAAVEHRDACGKEE